MSEKQYKRAMESCQSSSITTPTTTTTTLILILAIATVRQSIAASSVSVCSTLCTCTNHSFATVDCAFDTNTQWPRGAAEHAINQFVLDGGLHLPAGATALNIKLRAGGQLAIHKDFFQRNNVNHLSIDGSESRTGSSDTSVEFHEGALCNNYGGFPEVLVTNVGRLVLNKNISCGAHLLNITHVKDVLLKTEFLSVDGAEVFVKNVNNLQIEANAFGGSKWSTVQIHRTTIESLPKLGASFRLLSFNKCNISEIVSHAFDANEVVHVEFEDCRLTSLRQKAVTERLLSDSLIFRGCYIHRIERQFVDGSGLNNLLLDRNTIDEIAPGAFTSTSINTTVTGNHIIRTGKEWLHTRDWVNVTIAGNSFGEFNGILLPEAGEPKNHCYFGNNTITNALPNSFTFGHRCLIHAVHFGRECECTLDGWMLELFGPGAWHGETVPSTITSAVSCQVEESLRYCFNRSDAPPNETSVAGQVNVQYFLTEFCKKDGSKKCSTYAAGSAADVNHKPPPLIPFDRIDSLDESGSGNFFTNNTHWLVLAGVGLLFMLLSLTICLCRRRRDESRQTMTNTSSRTATIRSTSFNRSPSTFTPADSRIITSALAWLQESYDHKIWSEINVPMQQLLNPTGGTLEEQEKVRLIGTVIESLSRHDITGERIVALNDILYRHLGPPVPELVESTRASATRNDDLGHIYDELQLNRMHTTFGGPVTNFGLLGDYAAPLDHGTVAIVPEGIYSEPVLHDQLRLQRNGGNRNLISPYAIGDATVPRNTPSGEGNLPDVILLRPPWKRNTEEDDDDNDDEDEDEIDGEPERKTMLQPGDGDESDGGAGGGPTYAISMKQLKRPHITQTETPAPLATVATGDEQLDGTDGNRSEHSGSSMQTVRIEDMTLADVDVAGSDQPHV